MRACGWRADERTALSFRSDEPFRPDMRTAKLFIVIAKGKRTALLFFLLSFLWAVARRCFLFVTPFLSFCLTALSSGKRTALLLLFVRKRAQLFFVRTYKLTALSRKVGAQNDTQND